MIRSSLRKKITSKSTSWSQMLNIRELHQLIKTRGVRKGSYVKYFNTSTLSTERGVVLKVLLHDDSLIGVIKAAVFGKLNNVYDVLSDDGDLRFVSQYNLLEIVEQ